MWGVYLGMTLGIAQLCSVPLIGVFSSIPAVIRAAKTPVVIGAALQCMNGIVFIGEGIQQGNQDFGTLAKTASFSTLLTLLDLNTFGKKSLNGVWISLTMFYIGRLLGVLKYYFFDGPFSGKESAKIITMKKMQGNDGRQVN